MNRTIFHILLKFYTLLTFLTIYLYTGTCATLRVNIRIIVGKRGATMDKRMKLGFTYTWALTWPVLLQFIWLIRLLFGLNRNQKRRRLSKQNTSIILFTMIYSHWQKPGLFVKLFTCLLSGCSYVLTDFSLQCFFASFSLLSFCTLNSGCMFSSKSF